MMNFRRIALVAFVVLMALVPVLPVPEFWITQLNYIGLYSLVVIGLVLLTGVAGLTSFRQAAFGAINLLDSRPGRALRALKGGVVMAEAMGINTFRYKVVVFVLAALLASVAGWLLAHFQRTVNPSPFGLKMGIEYLFMAVI